MRVDNLGNAKEYWADPAEKTAGDEDPDSLYILVGRCLSQWESIENIFSTAFQCFLHSDTSAAKRAYGSIVSAGGRRDALRAAAEVFFTEWVLIPELEKKRFLSLLNHFGTASGRRNNIAHGIVKRPTWDNSIGWFLFPAEYNSGKNDAFLQFDEANLWSLISAQYRYTAADLAHFYDRFGQLALAAEEFVDRLKDPGSLQEKR